MAWAVSWEGGGKTEDLHVSHWWERLLDAGEGGGESQQSAHAQGHPGRGGLVVDPEGEPGDDDDHDAGDVHGHQEVGQFPGEDQVNLETEWCTRGPRFR